MSSKNLTKAALAVLGCAGASVAAPFLAPYLATISLPFFGTVLAGVINNEEFKENLGEAIGNTAAGFLTEIGGHFATDKFPRALSPEHNYHLEKMLATAYLNSLAAVEGELKAGGDEMLRQQAAQTLPAIRARIESGLQEKDSSALFPTQAADADFANRFSAENVTLLIADEERRGAELGEEIEKTLRRWLNEGRETEDRAARLTQLQLRRDTRLPEPLRTRLRAELPHRIAHQISELVKRDDFKESWIAFQRAHLQGILRVVERIETSQADIKTSVDALAQQVAGLVSGDEFAAAIAVKLGEFLRQTNLPPEQLEHLLERQSDELIMELRGIEARLGAKIEQSAGRLSAEGKENAAQVSQKIERVGAKVDESTDKVITHFDRTAEELKEIQREILQSASRAVRNRRWHLPAPPRDFTGRKAELAELRRALQHGGATISGVQGMGGVGKTSTLR